MYHELVRTFWESKKGRATLALLATPILFLASIADVTSVQSQNAGTSHTL